MNNLVFLQKVTEVGKPGESVFEGSWLNGRLETYEEKDGSKNMLEDKANGRAKDAQQRRSQRLRAN